MDFLKKIFGGGGNGSGRILYVYVRPKMCNKIMQIRIDTQNELSLSDDENGYVVRKVTKSIDCPFEVEVHLYFDKSKKLVDRSIERGEFVTEAEYTQQQTSES